MNSVSIWNMWKRRCSSATLWEVYRKEHEVTNLSFSCEKCNDDFHSHGGLKKHLRKVHDVRNLVLEGKWETEDSQMIFSFNNESKVWSVWESYKSSRKLEESSILSKWSRMSRSLVMKWIQKRHWRRQMVSFVCVIFADMYTLSQG